MVHAIVCRSLAAAGLLALAGCAQERVRPAYLGLSDIADVDAPNKSHTADEVPEVLRHIQSNKVLGAMAFERITGRTVDPDSLARSDNE